MAMPRTHVLYVIVAHAHDVCEEATRAEDPFIRTGAPAVIFSPAVNDITVLRLPFIASSVPLHVR